MKTLILSIALTLSLPSLAQAPAGAPAGANGICKDGSYSTAAVKSGACRGHKGVQTWYKADIPSAPPATPGKTAMAPVPTPRATTPSVRVPAPGPANTPSMPTPAPASNSAARPVPTTAPSMPSRPTPSAATSTPAMPIPQPAASGSGIASESARLKAGPAAAGGGPGLVWVNTSSKVYHCPGSDFYGKTKAGAYMSEPDAKAKGARPDHNKPCS